MSDTPKTDKLAKRDFITDGVWIRHARELERENAALREQVEELDAKWKMAEDQCFDQVGKIGELERENAALRALLIRIRNEKDLLKIRPGAQDQYAGMPPMHRLIDAALAKKS